MPLKLYLRLWMYHESTKIYNQKISFIQNKFFKTLSTLYRKTLKSHDRKTLKSHEILCNPTLHFVQKNTKVPLHPFFAHRLISFSDPVVVFFWHSNMIFWRFGKNSWRRHFCSIVFVISFNNYSPKFTMIYSVFPLVQLSHSTKTYFIDLENSIVWFIIIFCYCWKWKCN